MKCPACLNEMQTIMAGGVEVDACVGHCGGIWFDHLELKQVDEQHEDAGIILLDIERDPELQIDERRKRHCPVCVSITMMRHKFSAKRAVEIDECAQCGGIWLDASELDRIRNEYKNEAARAAAAGKHFSDVFDHQLDAIRRDNAEKQQKLEKRFAFARWLFTIPRKIAGLDD